MTMQHNILCSAICSSYDHRDLERNRLKTFHEDVVIFMSLAQNILRVGLSAVMQDYKGKLGFTMLPFD